MNCVELLTYGKGTGTARVRGRIALSAFENFFPEPAMFGRNRALQRA